MIAALLTGQLLLICRLNCTDSVTEGVLLDILGMRNEMSLGTGYLNVSCLILLILSTALSLDELTDLLSHYDRLMNNFRVRNRDSIKTFLLNGRLVF